MTATLGGTVAPVATSPDIVVVDTDAGDQLAKPGRQEQFCNNATRPGVRRGLPVHPGCRGHSQIKKVIFISKKPGSKSYTYSKKH